MNNILKELRLFYSAVHKIWDCYQASGPGKVDSRMYPAVEVSAERFLVLLAERDKTQTEQHDLIAETEGQSLRAAVVTASRLAKRCACDAAGLSFVTGEAGLIPRRDLIDEFLRSLQIIERACQKTS